MKASIEARKFCGSNLDSLEVVNWICKIASRCYTRQYLEKQGPLRQMRVAWLVHTAAHNLLGLLLLTVYWYVMLRSNSPQLITLVVARVARVA